MPKKIKKTDITKDSKLGIKPTKLKSPQGISFSFKYYQDGHTKFLCTEKEVIYWLTLLDRLKALSSLTAQDLLINRSSSLRCHPIKWEDTSESGFGLPNEEQLVDTPYQFSFSSNKHGRIHGFFIDEIFYIVWLDPDHLLYPAKN
ncbi:MULTISPECIES: hypothetical protein [Cyanophyceae]|uniref:hypothetical protein n=1 Tax=Cyanophyceae TaxID=3028117 RepID=UPI0023305773|nr:MULTISPECIES: hypothetical protein [Cyanophyceae]MDB9303254.1 hypothetical protein [Nodularia spumigena CS-591/12]MDB9351323.1 hypothetical protein [Nodularia spumigena CS-588/05]MDB9364498.1 hypothetical protein [Nodularia spumigena CS-588/02A10]MDB9398883.1 hypothetical protein [Microcystis aeruginosa CS-567/02-A1]MDB9499585.1 hypothetical protein [Nodularia spumigena CS-336/02]